MRKHRIVLAAVAALFSSSLVFAQTNSTPEGTEMTETTAPQTGYASVNGLEMYYEVHGSGDPIVVLHGAYMNADTMAPFVQLLAQMRQVIVPEAQGHGRTADIVDRPLSYEQFADDVAALLNTLGIEKADVFGYSMGGSTALQIAIRHPEKVNKLIVASTAYRHDGWHEDMLAMIPTITPEMFAGSPMETEYMRLAPNPENWPLLVQKLVALDSDIPDWSAESIQAITAPTMVIAGDSDSVRPEHVLEIFRLRGGGVNGDMTGLPEARLAILPGTTHIGVMFKPELVAAFVNDFLNPAPPPAFF
jgi:pimeloyl-ACP methyl ester carboxylesterase